MLNKKLTYDYIIVGQGLAGSVLANFLLQAGQKVLIIDADTSFESGSGANISSRIAAGLINPITGMRYVKSWKIDAFLPVAKATYQQIEQLLDIKIWHERSFMRNIKSIEDENQWLLRTAFEDYQGYCGDIIYPSVSEHISTPFKAYVEIKQAAQVNMPLLVQHFNVYFKSKNAFLSEQFDFKKLDVKENSVTYGDVMAGKIIFCEGARGALNPYFKNLPFNLDKGELLLVKIPNLDLKSIFKYNFSIIPLGDDLYWVGATNAWKYDDDKPTEANGESLRHELKSILTIPFEVVAHQSAIRPTVKDRRPFIGFHEHWSSVCIFNGFGTKGASLVPYWAKHFCDVLLSKDAPSEKKIQLDADIDINRFKK